MNCSEHYFHSVFTTEDVNSVPIPKHVSEGQNMKN